MSLIRPTKFAHIVYRTRRFAQMLQWYETVFGAKVQYQNPGLAFLTYDDEHHRFAFANMSLFQPDGTDTERQGASLYYADPDGNQIEFQVDSFETSEEATAFMRDYFSLNPLGVEFDPDDWLAQLRAGTPESEFLWRRGHEPVSPLRGELTKFLPAP